MAKTWAEYVLKFDNLMLESLRICSRNSMDKIYQTLHCDGSAKQSFLLHVDVCLDDQKVQV